MAYFALAGRFVLGLVFVAAALPKLRAGGEWRDVVASYRLLPTPIARRLASVLPLLELTVGGLLLCGVELIPTTVVSVLLLSIFSVAILINVLRKQRVRCGCFGPAGSGRTDIAAVLRNAGLIVLGGVTAGWTPTTLAIAPGVGASSYQLSTVDGTGVLVTVASLVATAALAAELRRAHLTASSVSPAAGGDGS